MGKKLNLGNLEECRLELQEEVTRIQNDEKKQEALALLQEEIEYVNSLINELKKRQRR